MKTFSHFEVNKIVRDYGYPPHAQRRARLMMQRRGTSWKGAKQAVLTVNAATAHANYEAMMNQDIEPCEVTVICGSCGSEGVLTPCTD